MKKQISIINALLLTVLFLVGFQNSVNAQQSNRYTKVIIEEYQIPAHSIQNLINGIQSDNMGLRNSSIFLVGQYKIKEAAEYLMNDLKNEKDPGVKILIAMSLYKIGMPEAINYIKDLAVNEEDRKVKQIYTAICNEYFVTNSIATAVK